MRDKQATRSPKPDHAAAHDLKARLARAPHGAVGFYNTAAIRADLGYARPHELHADLTALKHQGYVVLMGESLTDMTYRTAHTGMFDHNWMPDAVIIVPRALFDEEVGSYRARHPDWRGGFVNVGFFQDHARVTWLNRMPDGGGSRERVTGEFRASIRAAKAKPRTVTRDRMLPQPKAT